MEVNISVKLQNITMRGDDWAVIHEPHLQKDQRFMTESFVPACDNLYWITCPCGSMLLTRAEISKVVSISA